VAVALSLCAKIFETSPLEKLVVKKRDRVFHLGDVSFFGKVEMNKLLLQLSGKKILIKGNHDNHSNQWYLDVGFAEVLLQY
jgi:calcineurin-like phosphoesterase family protein